MSSSHYMYYFENIDIIIRVAACRHYYDGFHMLAPSYSRPLLPAWCFRPSPWYDTIISTSATSPHQFCTMPQFFEVSTISIFAASAFSQLLIDWHTFASPKIDSLAWCTNILSLSSSPLLALCGIECACALPISLPVFIIDSLQVTFCSPPLWV